MITSNFGNKVSHALNSIEYIIHIHEYNSLMYIKYTLANFLRKVHTKI